MSEWFKLNDKKFISRWCYTVWCSTITLSTLFILAFLSPTRSNHQMPLYFPSIPSHPPTYIPVPSSLSLLSVFIPASSTSSLPDCVFHSVHAVDCGSSCHRPLTCSLLLCTLLMLLAFLPESGFGSLPVASYTSRMKLDRELHKDPDPCIRMRQPSNYAGMYKLLRWNSKSVKIKALWSGSFMKFRLNLKGSRFISNQWTFENLRT